MAARYLLDTSICIQRQRPPTVLERFRKLKPGVVAISVITWGEPMYGAEMSRQRDKVRALLDEWATMVPVMPLPEAAGRPMLQSAQHLEPKASPSATTICGSPCTPRRRG